MNTLIIVSDIFGRTAALDELCSDLRIRDFVIVDPYGGTYQDFHDEPSAYQYFMSNVGIPGFTKKLADTISGIRGGVSLVGFSVGATAAWNISDKFNNLSFITCFYGSRIRDNMDIEPLCGIKLILPAEEPGYDVAAFEHKMRDKNNVRCVRTKYSHGFMNRLSIGFNETAYHEFIKI